MSAVCPNCRNHYSSDDQLHDHIQSDCWATRYEQRYPGEWTTSLKRYVHRALDPANRNGWAKADIIEEVKSMIQINRFVSARIRTWDNIELPQDADPRELPYVRSPRLASLYPYTANEKYYPEAYSVTKIGQCPRDVFNHETGELFVAYESSRELLLYADGACTRDGEIDPRGGCGFVLRCSDGIQRPWNPPKGAYSMHGSYFFRLEDRGPKGTTERATTIRAELRAVTAALGAIRPEYLCLDTGGTKIVVATASNYVVDGVTKWCKAWENNGWTLGTGAPVENQDLWELLLKRVRMLKSYPTRCKIVAFWNIPREWNTGAERVASFAATLPARSTFGFPVGGMPVLVDPSQL